MSRITPKAAKAKGRRLQQLVRDKIIKMLKPWGIQVDDVKSTAMGQGGEDVQLSPLARSFLPVSIECKSHKGFAVYKPYEQAVDASGRNEPILIIKGDHKKPLAVIDLEYYLRLELSRIERENNE